MLAVIHSRNFCLPIWRLKNVKIKIHKTTILPLVLYGFGIWSLALRKVQRLKAFDTRVLRGVFDPNRDKLTGGWRVLHNLELRCLYSSRSIIPTIKSGRMRWTGYLARMVKMTENRLWQGKPGGRRALGRPKRSRECHWYAVWHATLTVKCFWKVTYFLQIWNSYMFRPIWPSSGVNIVVC
jgi:hypothetical protein